MTLTAKFPPGHPEAVAQGCTCPTMENGHGKGARPDDKGGMLYWHNADCPVHTNKQTINQRGLSAREIEVVRELQKGFSSKEIARELGCSTDTVRTHLRSIYKILNVHNRTQAAVVSKKLGI